VLFNNTVSCYETALLTVERQWWCNDNMEKPNYLDRSDPVLLYLPQIPQRLSWDSGWVSVVRDQCL